MAAYAFWIEYDGGMIETGERFAKLASICGHLGENGAEYSDAISAMISINAALCVEPMRTMDVVRIVNRVYQVGSAEFRAQHNRGAE